MSKRTKPIDFVAWIAVSAIGYPAPIAGMSFTRRGLKAMYRETYGGDLDRHGYRAIKVRVQATK